MNIITMIKKYTKLHYLKLNEVNSHISFSNTLVSN